MASKYLKDIIGKSARRNISKGTPNSVFKNEMGYSGSIPIEKEPKQYYQICLDQEIPKELIFEIREFYSYLKSKD